MQNYVTYELTVFGGAGVAGVLLAFLYDLFRVKRRMVRTKRVFVHIEDILYWLLAAIIVFLFSYVLSSGETRVYFYAGTVIGGLVYLSLLSRPVLWILTTAVKILAWPFYEIFKFLRPIFHIISIHCQRTAGKVKNRGALEKYRVRVNFHRFRNALIKK